MIDKNSGLPPRIKSIIRDKLFEIRGLQLVAGVKSSELFKMINAVYRETGGNAENVFLIYLIRQLESQERR